MLAPTPKPSLGLLIEGSLSKTRTRGNRRGRPSNRVYVSIIVFRDYRDEEIGGAVRDGELAMCQAFEYELELVLGGPLPMIRSLRKLAEVQRCELS